MRLTFALAALALAACTPTEAVPPDDAGPCNGTCGPGTACVANRCVSVDSGAPGPDVGFDTGTDTGSALDTPAMLDAGSTEAGRSDARVDVDPRQSETCQAVLVTCDGRRVDVQTGERDGGLTYHCGACGVTCGANEACVNCVCER